MISKSDIIKGLEKLGLRRGDIVMVHSSYKSLGGVQGGPMTVVDAILDIIGRYDGVLIVPTFTFDFCEGFNVTGQGYFNLTYSTKMGVISETVRQMPDAYRTKNPIYSVAMLGRIYEELYSEDDYNVFGKKSLFAKLHKLNAKVLIIGVDYDNSLTFVHYVEDRLNVDYRYRKHFTGTIDDGYPVLPIHALMRVRDLDRGIVSDLQPIGEIMESQGIIKKIELGAASVKIFEMDSAYKCIAENIKKNPKLFYRIEVMK